MPPCKDGKPNVWRKNFILTAINRTNKKLLLSFKV